MLSSAVLARVGPFYHVTSAAKWASISVDGLRTAFCDPDDVTLPGVLGPYICLAARDHCQRYLHALRWKFEAEATVTIEVDPSVVASLRVDFDCTTSELTMRRITHPDDDELRTLQAGLPVICYDDIPAAALTLYARHPA